MRVRRIIKWGALGLLVLVVLGVVFSYMLVIGIPGRYRPARLSPQQREAWGKDFVSRVTDFCNDGQNNEPYTWSVTEGALNSYIASVDEIAGFRPGKQSGEFYREMTSAGVTEPAIVLGDDVVTVMVRTTKYNKILSVDLSFLFTLENRLSVSVRAVRVGHLPIPKQWIDHLLDRMKRELAERINDQGEDGKKRSKRQSSSERVARMLMAVGAGIDSEPIDTELTLLGSKKRVRIDRIEIADGKLTLHVSPSRRTKH